MTDRKYYLWLIPGVLVFGLALALVLTFQPVMAGRGQAELNARNEAGLQSVTVPQGVAVPQADINPTCILETSGSLAISHWPLNEGSGTTFADALAGSHDGTCSDPYCPSPIEGTNAGGNFFIDTDEDAITVPTDVAFDFLPAEPFSVGIWVKTTQSCTENKVFIGRYGTAEVEGRWWLGCVQGSTPGEGVARFHMRDSTYDNESSVIGTTPINDGKWHYLTSVWDGTDTLLYVDGAEDAKDSSPDFTGGNFNSVKPITIGAYDLSGGGYYSTGALDVAAVFDSALSKQFISDYIGTCDFSFTAGDVTFDTTKNVALPITADELWANTSGSGLSIGGIDTNSDKMGGITGPFPAGPFLYTPAVDYVGTDFFSFAVTDGVNTSWGNAIITQEGPQVTNPGPQTNFEGAAVSLQIVAVDPQLDVITYAATDLPTGLSIAADTGLISGKVAAGASVLSPYPVIVTVTDDEAHAT
ncbi:MAG: putative Ig domain-containing protein, partial [Anaerolineales bacterium]|nr:putative Ig domain-containing protein [Anaerolineales bacterium]